MTEFGVLPKKASLCSTVRLRGLPPRPFFASIDDFGAVASTHIRLLDDLPTQIVTSAGTLGDEDVFAGGTFHFEDGTRLLGADDLGHVDGGTHPPENYRKIAATTRLSHGTDEDSWSLTAMYYKGQGRNSTDQPLRAINEGLVGPFGTLDPTDGSKSYRWSVSGHDGVTGDNWKFWSSLYVIHSTMVLWIEFTHLLDDPINGDIAFAHARYFENEAELAGYYGIVGAPILPLRRTLRDRSVC